MKSNWYKRILCGILSFILFFEYIPMPSFAAKNGGLCPHHERHTEDCGYSPAVEAMPCTHEHSDECYQSMTECVHTHGDCSYIAPVEGRKCECAADENGIIMHTEGCGYVEASEGVPCDHTCSVKSGCVTKLLNCRHVHDSGCGYREAAAGSSCSFYCIECEKIAANKASAEAVAARIAALPTAEQIQSMSAEERLIAKEAVLSAQSAYNALTDEQKALIADAGATFTRLLEICDSIGNEENTESTQDTFVEEEYTEPTQDASAEVVASMIAALPTAGQIQGMSAEERLLAKEAVQSAQNAYNALTDEQKALIADAEATFARLLEICDSLENVENTEPTQDAFVEEEYTEPTQDTSAENVAAMIAALPTTEQIQGMSAEERLLAKEAVQSAQNAYNALTDEQKALIPDADAAFACLLECFESFDKSGDKETSDDNTAEDPEAPTILTWGEYYYTLLPDGTASICGFEGVAQNEEKPFLLKVPANINGAWVTEIAESAFAGNTKIEAVLLPQTVAAIGSGAFEGCENLRLLAICGETVTFEDTLARGAYSLEAIYVRHTQALSPILELLEHDFGSENGISLQSFETAASLEEALAAQNRPEPEISESIEDFTGIQTATAVTAVESSSTEDDTVVASGTCGDSLTWTLEHNVLTIHGFGEMYNYYWNTVPWHEFVSEIVAVELLGEITNIGNNAFYNAKSITSIDLPTTLTRIGDCAFDGCTGITEIEIPKSVTYIGHCSFRGANFTEITIPESVVSIGYSAFDECLRLETVYLYAADAKVGTQIFPDNCESSKDISLIVGRSVKKIPDGLFNSNSSCTALLTSVFFEEDSQCEEIGARAFEDCIKLENITLPNKLMTIGAYAFSCCSLQSITLPDTITEIGECAFYNNSQLAIVNIPSNVSTIGKYAFLNCTAIDEIYFNATEMNSLLYDHKVFYCAGDLEKGITVTIGKDVTKIPAYLFHNRTNIVRVVFEKDSVCETIGEFAFAGCSKMEEIEIPHSVTNIECFAFSGCSSLKSIVVPESVTELGRFAFSDCTALTEVGYYSNAVLHDYDGRFYNAGAEGDGVTVTIGSNVASIPAYVFSGYSATYEMTNIKAVIFEDNSVCKSIGYGAFRYCPSLERIAIPGSVTCIGSEAFKGCTSLRSVTIPSGATDMGYNTFSDCPELLTAGPLGSDCNIEFGWGEAIPAYAFYGCSSIIEINLPERVVEIGNGAFQNARCLTSVKIPESVTAIGKNCFTGCRGLKTVGPLGSNCNIEFGWAKEIPVCAFENCDGLEEITIPESITSIGKSAFKNCTKLTTIYYNAISIPDNINSDYSAFPGAGSEDNGITIVIGPSVMRIPSGHFNKVINKIDFGSNSVCTEIGDEAFTGCTNLTTVIIPESITQIGYAAFRGCSGLSQINYNAVEASCAEGPFPEPFDNAGTSDLIFIVGNKVTKLPDYLCKSSNISQVIFAENSVCKSIGACAFVHCENLTKINIPESVTEIGVDAFGTAYGVNAGKSGLTSAGPAGGDYSIEFSWTDAIPANAFHGCSTLTEVHIPESISKIGENAFRDCNHLTSVTIPENVSTIEKNAFKDCRRLEEILFYPTSMNDLYADSDIFHCRDGYASAGIKVTIGPNVTRIPAYLFGTEDHWIRSVNIAEITFKGRSSCTSIGKYAFYRCSELKSVYFPVSITTVEKSAFGKCYDLSDVYYYGSEEEWKAISISYGNEPLTSDNDFLTGSNGAVIHYNWKEEYNGSSEQPQDTSVRYFSSWDSENQIAYFETDPQEDPLNFGCQVTGETDTSFLENVDELVGTYVLVESKKRDDGMIAPDILLSISAKPVATKYGVVTGLRDNGVVVIDGVAFRQPDTASQFAIDVGDAVRYHLLDGNHVGSVAAQKLSMRGKVSALEADCVTIGSIQYTISPYASKKTKQSLETSIQKGREVDFFANGGVIFQSKLHPVPYDVPGYNVPGIEFDYDQPQDPAEGYVYDYRDKWRHAYEEYAEAVLAALQSYAGNTETQKQDTIKAQAAAMKKHDREGSDKYITVSNPTAFKQYEDEAYEALSTYFYEELSGYSVPTLNAIDPKNPLSGAKFVNLFLKNMGNAGAKKYIINDITIEIMPYGDVFGLAFGSMTIEKADNLIITIGNSQEDIQETVVSFLEELQSFTKKQTYKAVDIFYTETDALGIYKVSKEYLGGIESKIKKQMGVAWDKVVEKAGLGDLMKDLDTCYNYYRFANQAINTLNSEDIQEALKNISELIKFEEKSIKNAAVGKAMDKLKDAAKKLDRSLVEYLDGTILEKEASFLRMYFNCPVNVSVFNSAGAQIGYIGEDDLWYSDGLVIRRVGESKEIVVLTGDLPTFVATATDYGTMSVVMEEYDDGNPIGRLNYYDIALDPGKNFSITPTSNIQADADTLALQSSSGPIYASEYISTEDSAAVNISCSAEGIDGLTLYGAGAYVRGNPAAVFATPVEGYDFVGWFENGSLVCDSIVYYFTARGDRTLTARFRQEDTVDVELTYSDGGVAIGGGRFSRNRKVTVLAIANDGYTFDGWFADGKCISKDEEYSFEVSGHEKLEARFAESTHTHSYTAPEFSWSKDNSCSATFTCGYCRHTETINCVVTYTYTPPVGTQAGETVYTAIVEFNGVTYTDTRTIASVTEHIADNVGLRKATLEEEGRKPHIECSVCGKYFKDSACTMEANEADYIIPAIKIVRLSSTRYSYDGKTKTPKVGVYDSAGNKLVRDIDYTVTYAKGRKAVGQYNVTMKGIGDYDFRTTLTFKILPPKSAVYTPKALDNGFTAKWVKKTSQVTGYQLQYSLKKDFSDAVTVTIKSNTTVSKSVKKLKNKKTYYVRIRTYKVVGSSKFYSSWSAAKTVKTK